MKSARFLGLLLASTALANDAPFLSTGSSTPMKGQHPHVGMVSEDVYLKVYYRNYDVDARFRFYNDGPAQTVRMGFPEWGHDYQRDKTPFQKFRTSVDGVSVPVQRIVEKGTPSDYSAWWVKTVHFQAYQTRTVTVCPLIAPFAIGC